MSKVGFSACQSCRFFATLRTLDLEVPARPARKDAAGTMRPELPAGWVPLIALCGNCWDFVVRKLRENATPDSSGAVSP